MNQQDLVDQAEISINDERLKRKTSPDILEESKEAVEESRKPIIRKTEEKKEEIQLEQKNEDRTEIEIQVEKLEKLLDVKNKLEVEIMKLTDELILLREKLLELQERKRIYQARFNREMTFIQRDMNDIQNKTQRDLYVINEMARFRDDNIRVETHNIVNNLIDYIGLRIRDTREVEIAKENLDKIKQELYNHSILVNDKAERGNKFNTMLVQIKAGIDRLKEEIEIRQIIRDEKDRKEKNLPVLGDSLGTETNSWNNW